MKASSIENTHVKNIFLKYACGEDEYVKAQALKVLIQALGMTAEEQESVTTALEVAITNKGGWF